MNKYTAIGIHTFAGLMTEGIKRVFDVPLVINDGYGNDTHIINHPETLVYSWRNKERVFQAPTTREVDLIFAQPPCAPWSNAGKTLGLQDPRLECTEHCFELVKHLNPSIFAMESVAAAYKKGLNYYEQHALNLAKLGYLTYHLLIDNQYHGTPQKRLRYFFIASKKPLYLHPMTHSLNVSEVLKGIQPGGEELIKGSAKRALEKYGYNELEPGMRLCKWYDIMTENHTYHADGRCVGRPPFGDVRLNGDSVAGTFTGHYSMIHHIEDRPITMNEAKALCGVRQDYIFEGSTAEKHSKLLARSVMPNTAEWLAKSAEGTLQNLGVNLSIPEHIDLRSGNINII